MKKYLVIALALAIAAFAAPAFAGIQATPHDISGIQGGTCAACHLPHGALGGNRLWPSAPTVPTGFTYRGAVSRLCGYCHATGGGGGQAAAVVTTWVYGSQSHGVVMSIASANLPYSQGRANLAVNFPYYTASTDGNLECTTCHDVHNDPSSSSPTGYRPFLRANVQTICSMCHMERRYENGVVAYATAMGAWTVSTRQGVNNPGSHPVGTDITGDVYRAGKSPINVPQTMSVLTSSGDNTWILGGHLTGGGTGGVNCITCHGVHGIKYDSHMAGIETGISSSNDMAPNTNFLIVSQGSGQTYNGRSVANGYLRNNALCEACHQGAPYEEDTLYNTTVGTTYPNPGGTSWGHPVNDMDVVATGWVPNGTAFPASAAAWPIGTSAYKPSATGGPDPVVICESCHSPHPAANVSRGDNTALNQAGNGFTVSDYLLRDDLAGICGKCHNNSLTRHHPVDVTFDSPASGGANYLANVVPGNQMLDCSTCHVGAGAHNWTGFGAVGLDPSWLPADNGRSAANTRYNTQMSRTCMDCHYYIATGTKNFNPTLKNGSSVGAENVRGRYNTLGDATHYIGKLGLRKPYNPAATNDYWTADTRLKARMNPQTTAFGSAYGGSGGFARWGNTTTLPVVVCESCHELEPNKNAAYHLLLGFYSEGDIAQTRNQFCEACHAPKGTHQMTGMTVTRTGAALNVDFTTYWLDDPATVDSNPRVDEVNNRLNCDSCHQPHQAPVRTTTFIVDVNNAILGTGTQTAGSGSVTTVYGYAYCMTVWGGTSRPKYNGFCDVCHNYQ